MTLRRACACYAQSRVPLPQDLAPVYPNACQWFVVVSARHPHLPRLMPSAGGLLPARTERSAFVLSQGSLREQERGSSVQLMLYHH